MLSGKLRERGVMSREIKFRGKRVDNGEWVYGSLVEIALTAETSIVDWDSPSYSRREVDPDTVGQFTDLKDKNDKEIYEGDILRLTNPKLWPDYSHVVKWNESLAQFVISSDSTRHGRPLHEECSFLGFKGTHGKFGVEVIGNIWESPELLK